MVSGIEGIKDTVVLVQTILEGVKVSNEDETEEIGQQGGDIYKCYENRKVRCVCWSFLANVVIGKACVKEGKEGRGQNGKCAPFNTQEALVLAIES